VRQAPEVVLLEDHVATAGIVALSGLSADLKRGRASSCHQENEEDVMTPTAITEQSYETDPYRLAREVERYLACVAAFRAEGCEPAWRAEALAAPTWSAGGEATAIVSSRTGVTG
jgi:hypothetical protein